MKPPARHLYPLLLAASQSLLAGCGSDSPTAEASDTPSNDVAGGAPSNDVAGGAPATGNETQPPSSSDPVDETDSDGPPEMDSDDPSIPPEPEPPMTDAGDAVITPPEMNEDPEHPVPDPQPGEYGTRAELIEANSEMAVAELDGVIYVVGGYPSSREVQSTVQAYHIATDTWELVRPHPIPIHHPVVKGVMGKLYSLGGQEDTGLSFVYDPTTTEWSPIATMPTARGGGAAAVIGDQIYVAGGRPPANNAFEVYDISDDAWQELAPLPRDVDQRNHLSAAAIGGKIYVAGGRYDGGGFGSPRTDVLDVYDPDTSEWTRAAPMLRPRGGHNGVEAYGCFFNFGGEGQDIGEPNDVYPDHDVYNPSTDTWTALDPLPTPVHGVTGAAFVDGLIYMPGGGTRSGGTSGSLIFQVYRPEVRCD